jgi:S-DNA-T family DNA segregation ATPase FtsK/SpoIIIE
MGGVRIKNVQEGVLPSTPKLPKRSLKVDLTSAMENFAVVVPVTKIDQGRQFVHYFNAVQAALTDSTAGALLVHPRSEPHMGQVTKAAFDEAIRQGRLRVFALTDQTASAERLECLLTFLDRAAAEELQLDGQTLSVKDCQDLLLKTGVLDGLDLYKALGGWGQSAAVRSAKPMGPPPSGPKPAPVKTPTETVPRPVETPRPTAMAARASNGSGTAVEEAVVEPRLEKPTDWAGERLAELVNKLKLWGFPVEAVGADVGPTFARLKVRPSSSRTTFKKVCDKAVDLKIHLSLDEPPLIGDQAGYISVDVQRPNRQTVTLEEVLANPPPGLEGQPAFPVGKDVAGHTHWLNLADPGDCHLLVAGTTGSGKSEFLKAMIAALARRLGPHELQFVLIDPKQVTFNLAGHESPYIADPIACSIEDAGPLIERGFTETEERYDLLRRCNRENIAELQGADGRPHMVLLIDEFADLMADKEAKKTLETTLKRIGAKARAAGIHLVLATQRPEAPGVVTTQLRSNLPGRICFRVAGEGDSRIMLGSTEAAHLLGKGDLLWKHGGGMIRLQSPRVEKAELAAALRLS